MLLGGDVPPAELQRLVDHSYARVLHSLTAAQRRFLTTRYSPAELGLDQR